MFRGEWLQVEDAQRAVVEAHAEVPQDFGLVNPVALFG